MFEKEPEDIFSGVEPAGQEPLRPRGAVAPTVPGRPGEPARVGAALSPDEGAARAPKKKIFLVIVAVVLFIVLGGAGYFIWQQFIVKPVPTILENVPIVVNVNESVAPPAEEVPPAPEEVLPPVLPPTSQDTDFDGLSDEEEIVLGTDINKIDTDEDELTDREEVKIYDTDPLNPDTDGDTYLDGAEVKAGYNPKGPGRLLELPQ